MYPLNLVFISWTYHNEKKNLLKNCRLARMLYDQFYGLNQKKKLELQKCKVQNNSYMQQKNANAFTHDSKEEEKIKLTIQNVI